MTKEQWAEQLNGRSIGNEVTSAECKQLEKDGLVVVFGGSDDLMEFRGCIYDEFNCYNGGTALLNSKGPIPSHEENRCDCAFCGYKEAAANAKKIEAIWDEDGISWQYRTEIPHATFDVMDGEKYCRGIVFEMSELV